MRRSLRLAGTAIFAIVLTFTSWLVAAASETDRVTHAQGAKPQNDACVLLTKQDAAAAIGEAVTGPKGKTLPGGQGATVSYCEYEGSGLHRIQLDLTRLTASAVPMYKAMCSQKASKDLAGLGEVACWYNEKHEELHAYKGTNFISIDLKRGGDPTEAIKAVMKQAIARVK